MAKSIYEGRAVWRELMTDDVEKAKAFYSKLFGWTWKDMPMGLGQPSYPIAHVGEKGIGGIMQKPKDAPSFWLTYVSVPDVDRAIARAKEGGGDAIFGPTDVPEVGRLAAIRDFAGAVIAMLKPTPPDQPRSHDRPKPGEFCWETLSTPDIDRAKSFYGSVFGWTTQKGPGDTGDVFAVGPKMEDTVADIQKAEHMPPAWMTYVVVENADDAREKAAELGAKIVVPLIEIPQIGRIAFVADPTGGHIGLFEPAPM